MSRDSYEILHEQIHAWLHRKNISSSVRRVSTLPVVIATDIGLVRKENQDRVAVLKFRPYRKNKDMVVVALADGMGGMEGGANAASLTLSTFFTEIIKNSDLPIRQCLEKAVLRANESVLKIYRGNGGSTLSAIVVDDYNNITAINVGDSRIYGIATENIEQISEDDTLAALAKKYNGLKSGDINSRLGGELVQFIGLDGALEIHFHHINYVQDGVLFLTSDGAHTVGDSNLHKLYSHSSNTGIYTRRVIDLASWFGGFDNATIATVELSNILKELDTSSGDGINLWDPFGEMKVISIASTALNTLESNEAHRNYKENLEKISDTGIQNNNKENLENSKNNFDNKKETPKRKPRTRSKNKSKETSDKSIETSNRNDKLENISQLDISFSEKNSIKGDKDE